jgi:hypothetical protein
VTLWPTTLAAVVDTVTPLNLTRSVAVDARNGFVSVMAAVRDYGVVPNDSTFVVDEEATVQVREVHRQALRMMN